MAFTQTFTGKGTSQILDNSTAMSAQKGLSDMILDAEKIRHNAYEKNRAEFLKNSNIDPEFIFSDSARKTVQGMISNFNDKYGKLAQQYNYNMPDEVRMQMQTEKNLIIAEQQNQTTQYEMWKQHRDLVAKNPGVFSQDEFIKATDYFMQHGKYNQTMPAYEPHDFGQALNKAYLEQKNKIPIGMRPIGGGKQVEEYYTMDESQYNGLIASVMANDPNAAAGLLKEIEQNKEEIFANADANGNNVLDSGEKENAIINWVKQKHPRAVVTGTPSTIPGYNRGGLTDAQKEKEQAKIGVQDETVPKEYGITKYDDNGSVISQGRTYSPKSFHFAGGTTIKNISTKDGVALDKYSEDELSAGVVDAELVLYDPRKKVFLIKSMKPSPGTDQPSNALIEIPRENIRGFANIKLQMGDNVITPMETDNIYKYSDGQTSKPTVPDTKQNADVSKTEKWKEFIRK